MHSAFVNINNNYFYCLPNCPLFYFKLILKVLSCFWKFKKILCNVQNLVNFKQHV